MKNSHINIELSLATKKLHRAARKAARKLGNMTHPGLVHTASPHRDVALMITAFLLEALSLALLWFKLPFGLGIIAGLAAFDTAGALLAHAGMADRNWRAAEIEAASTPEEKAAIVAQRPGYFKWLRALGMVLILGPLAFKVGSLLILPHALQILGGFAPALMVAFFGVAAIHLFATGYALAHLRFNRAERRDRLAMLRSGRFAGDRERHENWIKATREHRFVTFQHLKSVQHTDGHSLQLESIAPDGRRHYLLTTRGHFDDADLDFMVNGQPDSDAMTVLGREGLRAQLAIEESEPLTSSKLPPEREAPPAIAPERARALVADAGPVHATVQPAAVSGNDSTPAVRAAMRGVAMAVVGVLSLGLAGCGPEKPESVKLSLVATQPLTRTSAHLPESVLALLAPPVPLAGKFVPLGEIVRLDLPGENTESLAPEDTANGTQKALEVAWQIESAELELAKASDSLHARVAGLAAKPAADLDADTAAKRLAEYVTGARKEGREVLAVTRAAKDGAVTIAPGVSVDARTSVKAAIALIEERLRAGAEASVVVLLDPPAFAEPAPKLAGEPVKTARTEEKESTPPVPAAAQPEPQIVSVPGSTTMVIVNPGNGEKQQVVFQLPEGSQQIGEAILFGSNSARLTEKARKIIEEIANAVKSAGGWRVTLVAGADPVGTEEANLRLASLRGAVVKAALIARGLAVDALIPVGDCLAPSNTPSAQRAEFRAVKVYTTVRVPAALH